MSSSRSATDCEDSERSEASGESSEEERYRSSAEEQSDGKENNKVRKESKSLIHQPSTFIKNKKQHHRTVLRNKIHSAEQRPLKKNAKNRARQTRLRTVPSKPYEEKFDDSKPVRRTVHVPPGAKRATIIVKQAGTADRVLDLYSQKRCQILGA